jgi:glycosyltransferase involved in cell wall biosynthesis
VTAAILARALTQASTDTRRAGEAISACLAVRNEEAVIERCLRSLEGAVDEIVLVHDGNCEDATLDIAARHGCRVFVRPPLSPEHQRVFAYRQARGEWLLRIDADEFLSEDLRANLRKVIKDPTANGHTFVWPMWDGKRYVTRSGAPRLALFRRDRVHVLGLPESWESVDPPIRHWPYLIEHRPIYNNFTPAVIATKWRRRALTHARSLVSDFAEIPKFNYLGPGDWSLRRRVVNRLSPLLVLPAAAARFAIALAQHRSHYTWRENVQFAAYEAIYAAMVQAYVAKLLYLDRRT